MGPQSPEDIALGWIAGFAKHLGATDADLHARWPQDFPAPSDAASLPAPPAAVAPDPDDGTDTLSASMSEQSFEQAAAFGQGIADMASVNWLRASLCFPLGVPEANYRRYCRAAMRDQEEGRRPRFQVRKVGKHWECIKPSVDAFLIAMSIAPR